MWSWPLTEAGTRLGSRLLSWSISWDRRSLKKSSRVVNSTSAAEAVGACLWEAGILELPLCKHQQIVTVRFCKRRHQTSNKFQIDIMKRTDSEPSVNYFFDTQRWLNTIKRIMWETKSELRSCCQSPLDQDGSFFHSNGQVLRSQWFQTQASYRLWGLRDLADFSKRIDDQPRRVLLVDEDFSSRFLQTNHVGGCFYVAYSSLSLFRKREPPEDTNIRCAVTICPGLHQVTRSVCTKMETNKVYDLP